LSFWKVKGELSLEASTSLVPGVTVPPFTDGDGEEEVGEEAVEEEEEEEAAPAATKGEAVLEVVTEEVMPVFCWSRRF